MLILFDFAVVQMRYVKAAMDEIPSFRPDGEAPAVVQARIDAALAVRAEYVTKKTAIDAARAMRRTTVEVLHEGCVDFTAQARSRYRNTPALVQRIDRLPVQDQTFQETLTRADMIVALWTDLPQVGTPPQDFSYGHELMNVSLLDFASMKSAAVAADAAIPGVDQQFQKAEGNLHTAQEGLEDFVTAALELGRSRYSEGTPEREIIDAVPTSSPANVPEKAVITGTSVPEGSTIRVDYTAPGATSYDIFYRQQGIEEWTLAGDDVIVKTFDITGLASSTFYEIMVRPRNSRGNGPDSDIVTVELPS